MTATIADAGIAALVDRLATHRTLGEAPRRELEWLAAHGEFRRYGTGDLLSKRGEFPDLMIILLSGGGAVYIDRGGGRRKWMEWQAGDVTGVLPFSRMNTTVGEPVIERPTDALVLHRAQLPEMIRECPAATAAMVHTMLDRVRHFSSTDWQDDKMMSLGRLAAGLSHEINNPASAASRSAKLLDDALTEMDEAASALLGKGLNHVQRAQLEALRRHGSTVRGGTQVSPLSPLSPLSPIDRADREDEIAAWLDEHRVSSHVAAALVDAGISVDQLETLARTMPADCLDPAVRWIAASHASRSLATDVERATTRIYELVSAVKRFTYMDRPTVAEPSSIAQALADTVAVLGAKAKSKSVTVTLDVPADLPLVRVFGGELNQVWSNLIENALDAVAEGGKVAVNARAEKENVVVRVIDDGCGIVGDDKHRIFDPFFTTKPVGQGTGLGLDIARRIVRRHDGQIEFDSEPGHTEFRVILPAPNANPINVPEQT
jgi:signal transduction histidine kinase